MLGAPWKTLFGALAAAEQGHTVQSPSRPSRDCSEYMSCTVSPITSSPPSGTSWPMIMRNSVDLPEPLPPMMPAQGTAGGGGYFYGGWHAEQPMRWPDLLLDQCCLIWLCARTGTICCIADLPITPLMHGVSVSFRPDRQRQQDKRGEDKGGAPPTMDAGGMLKLRPSMSVRSP